MRRVLIADPDDRVLDKLRDVAQAAGYAVSVTPTARGLLEAVRKMPTHLVALAMDLPDMGPADLVEKIHASYASLPIVLIARHGADPRQGTLRQSVSACVFKPVDPGRFLGVCERILRLSDQRLGEGDWRSEPRRSIQAEVLVDVDYALPLRGTLVNLSARGFRIQLPEAVGMGRSLVVSVHSSSAPALTFEGRVLWEKPMTGGTLAGGDLVRLRPEDERALAALLQASP